MRSARYRKPVRDPVAGILSDWFGIENGSAQMLWALYQGYRPLTIPQIIRRTGLSPASVTQCSGRLRKAGINLPSQRGKRVPTYELPLEARREVRRALAHALDLLGAVVPDMARLENLEDALGLNYEPPPEYGLTRGEGRIFGMIQKTNLISRERIFVALYGHLDDPPTAKTIDVMVCKMRPKLARHGITITGLRGGYEMAEAAG